MKRPKGCRAWRDDLCHARLPFRIPCGPSSRRFLGAPQRIGCVVRFMRGEGPSHSSRQGRSGTREKWAPTEHRPPRVFDRRSRAAFVAIVEGQPPCRPIFARLSRAPFLKNPPCAGAPENHGADEAAPSSWGWLGFYAVGEFRNLRMANSAVAAASGTRWCCMAKPWGIFWPM